MESMLAAARRAAEKGGERIRQGWGNAHEIRYKGETDLVTETDLDAQNAITAEIRSAFPDHSILTEEEGGSVQKGAELWIIDPLDGTTNFAHRFPFVCVSIACRREGETRVGVIYNPILNQMFWAERGRGAFFNGNPMRVTRREDLRKSLVATGFPYEYRGNVRKEVITRLDRMIASSRGVRRAGSAAMDLAYVACGIFDGFWEQELKPWDIAAGALLVEEAGGRVGDFGGAELNLDKGEILASNALIHEQMMAELDIKGNGQKP